MQGASLGKNRILLEILYNPETVYDVGNGEFSRRAVWRAIGLPNLSPLRISKRTHLKSK